MSIAQEYDKYDVLGLAELVRCKEVKPIELVEAAIERIERVNPTLNCVCIKTYDLARKLAEGPLPKGPFTGVPFLVKDLALMYAGVKTTNAASFFKDFVAPDDSVTTQRLKQSGLILVGKTNVPEFGSSISTESRFYGLTRNPWNLEHVAGGSSGGSAAAVAARIVPFAYGNDGGGSIRNPASNCGLVGLKPSRGRNTWAPYLGDYVYGCAVESCVSLTVRDSATFLDVIGGAVPGDVYQLAKPERPFLEEVKIDPGKLKIGFTAKSPTGEPVAPACVEAVEGAAKLCAELGHEVIESEFTFGSNMVAFREGSNRLTYVLFAVFLQASKEMVGRMATDEDFNRCNWEMMQQGKTVDGVQHAMDIDAMRHLARQIAKDCEPFDIVLTPTMTVPPQRLGTYDTNMEMKKFLSLLVEHLAFTQPFNYSGQPAISLPLHWSEEGLPIGVQFVGRYAEEATIFRLAGQIEKARPWIERKPPVCA